VREIWPSRSSYRKNQTSAFVPSTSYTYGRGFDIDRPLSFGGDSSLFPGEDNALLVLLRQEVHEKAEFQANRMNYVSFLNSAVLPYNNEVRYY
jgi:hypothetical protein